jgi:hypothetical protein
VRGFWQGVALGSLAAVAVGLYVGLPRLGLGAPAVSRLARQRLGGALCRGADRLRAAGRAVKP